jgi:hypothetical protein
MRELPEFVVALNIDILAQVAGGSLFHRLNEPGNFFRDAP